MLIAVAGVSMVAPVWNVLGGYCSGLRQPVICTPFRLEEQKRLV